MQGATDTIMQLYSTFMNGIEIYRFNSVFLNIFDKKFAKGSIVKIKLSK